MIIFGFSHLEPYAKYFHDTNISIMHDDRVMFASLEERFSRLKHHAGYPFLALKTVQENLGFALADADIVAIAENRLPRENRVTNAAEFPFPAGRIKMPAASPSTVFYCDHQLAHASVAFRLSPFDDALVITLDGMGHDQGNPCFGAVFQGKGNTLVRKRTCWSDGNSLGLLYGFVTEALGWRMSDGEGKTMGLAGYGDPTIIKDEITKLAPRIENGHLVGGRRFRPKGGVVNNRHMVWDPVVEELSALAETAGRENLAAAMQAVLEDTAIAWVQSQLKAFPKTRNVCLGGGIFLNVALNSRLRHTFPGISFYVPPSPADGGIGLGAALEAAAQNGAPRTKLQQCQFLGGEYSVDPKILAQNGLRIDARGDPTEAIAESLERGEVVGLYQGRSEWGPRALGNRSVLAHPGLPGMRDRINKKLKRREPFMPFAPAIKRARLLDWFDGPDRSSPYMMFTHKAKPSMVERIAQVLHVDQTGRVQTVSEMDNPLLNAILDAFEYRVGMPLLLNTSFNLHGLPLVESPRDAKDHLLRGCVDSLYIGGALLRREDAKTGSSA
ncbi:carbamoyltransferase C-terminal domain-containing protein [Marinobacter sp. P4B1]|uniref:carbamoyltransferase C-terminal domain-containing protein n=1 Tax=Marinobacter sp. P4B1 TaxID=1119533 RepID=UPI00071D7AB5|nr:carbamoyltransferase C-terminal domain-containing protein [Marinobacter sp. P4B1]KRW82221.1 hypothetical protein AQ621_11450 [Marinobacter sp. P4B1]